MVQSTPKESNPERNGKRKLPCLVIRFSFRIPGPLERKIYLEEPRNENLPAGYVKKGYRRKQHFEYSKCTRITEITEREPKKHALAWSALPKRSTIIAFAFNDD